MHHRSPLRQLIASVTIATLVAGTLAPPAAAQGSSAATQPQAPASPPKQADQPDPGSGAASPTEEERREQARAAFQAAQQAFEEQNFETAYENFRAAHQQVPSPHTEYWMAASLDLQSGHEAEAARAYQVFLANPGAVHVGDDKIAYAKERLSQLKSKLPAQVTITTDPPGAQISIDGTPQEGVTPLTVKLPAGAHKIEATLSGHQPVTTELHLEGGSETEQKLTLEPQAEPVVEEAPPPPPAEESVERSMLPAYITLGLAGAGLVTGTIFGIRALSDKGDFNDNPSATRADSLERNALIADMAFGVAITLGITGIVLLTSSDSADETTAKAKKKEPGRSFLVAPFVGPGSGGAAARLTF